MCMTEILIKNYFGKELYEDIERYFVSKIISLMFKNNNLIIVLKGHEKVFYLDWLKFYEMYKDINNNCFDESLKKYHFEFCEVSKFTNAKEMYEYIVKMIKLGIKHEKN